MNFEQLLVNLNTNEINLKLEQGKVKVFDPLNNLNEDLVYWLKNYKHELTEWLSEGGSYSESDFSYSHLTAKEIAKIEAEHFELEKLYIATPLQVGFLYHGMLDGGGASYITQWYCDLLGDIETDKMQQAWQLIVDRHDILRTCFVGLDTEQVHQLVEKNVELPFVVEDWRNIPEKEQAQKLQNARDKDKNKGFDFEKAPLMRITIYRLADNKYHFSWIRHHVLLDGWSSSIVFGEVLEAYRALVMGNNPQFSAPGNYEQYIGWLFKQDTEKAKLFWQEHLSGFMTPTPMLSKKVAVDTQESDVRTVRGTMSESVSSKLTQLAKSTRCTMNVIMQAAWSYLLHRYSGEKDVVFGSTVSGRPANLDDVEKMMGLFINTIPVRVGFDNGINLGDVLKSIHLNGMTREEHGYLSLADIQRVSEVGSGVALFDTLLGFENQPSSEDICEQANSHSQEFSVDNVSGFNQSNFGLVLLGFMQEDRLNFALNYQCDQFSETQIKRLTGQLEKVLTAMAIGGETLELNTIDILTEKENQLLLNDWNDTGLDYPSHQCIHQLIEEQVEQTPNDTAVVFENQRLTFKELNERSNQLAHFLIEQGVRVDSLVGLCVERSIDMIVAMLGIMKAGGAYVPLDPTYPQARLDYMLRDAGVSLVVTQNRLINNLPQGEYSTICLDDSSQYALLDSYPNVNVDPCSIELNSENLAYMIYTSGSTGKPKGVLVTHASLVNFLCFAEQSFLPEHIQGSVVSSPVAFDATVQSLFTPLVAGKYVELLPEDALPLETLSNKLFNDDVELLFKITPAHLKAISAQGISQSCNAKHVIVVAGELLTSETLLPWLNRYLPSATFINEYGPTEATVGSSIFPIEKGFQIESFTSGIPIGKPLANVQYYVLDQQQRMLPIGAEGELYIGGRGLARGYHNLSQMTEEKFITNPFSTDTQSRLYRTGDQVRWREDGNLEYISRVDNQVKIRGFRIELGEIESILRNVEDVKDVVVVAHSEKNREKRLVCYLVNDNGLDEDDDVLRKARQSVLIEQYKETIGKQLPEYMIPAFYVFLDVLPLTPNGKLDRQNLPEPESAIVKKETYVAPRNETEKELCCIWQDVLKMEQVGIEDNFFALGGDSIISIQLVSRAKTKGLNFGVRELLESPTIATLSSRVNQQTARIMPQEAVTGQLSLLPIQKQFFELPLANPHHYNQAVLVSTAQGFNLSALEQIVEAVYLRHDALRLRFNAEDRVAEHLSFDSDMLTESISYYDLSKLEPSLVDQKTQELCTQVQASMNFDKGPLLRAMFIDLGNGQGRLMLAIHHLVIDGVSWRILMTDIELAWRQFQKGLGIQLAPKTSSLQQWGQALHQYAWSSAITLERDYWLNQSAIEVTPIPKRTFDLPDNETNRQLATFSLSESETKFLLGESNDAYRTRINELLLAGLLSAYQKWSGGLSLTLDMEGHGREDMFEQLDISETVGWFTAIYPLTLAVERGADIGELIRAVKEQIRQVPNKGVGYGILKNIRKDEELDALSKQQHRPQIKFNYLGQMDNVVSEQSVFGAIEDGDLVGPSSALENRSTKDLVITGTVSQGQLKFSISLGGEFKPVDSFATLFKQSLISIVSRCENIKQKNTLMKNKKVVANENSELREKGILV